MLAFIYNNFKLDLTHLRVTFNDVNPWFQEELSSEYSFPFKIPVRELQQLGDYTNYNATGLQTSFIGKLYRDGEVIDATLKIHEGQGDFISGYIYAGLDGLAVLDVQLSELPLDNFTVVNLKEHAEDTITKDYPEVSHNFPPVHTDKYDPESEEYHNFEKVINKYGDGAFIENTLQEETNIDDIRNLMQPLPYLMHVLLKGFEHKGFTLEGDILTDPDYKRALIFRDGDYHESDAKESIPLRVAVDEWYEEYFEEYNGIVHVTFEKLITIEKKGDYVILGSAPTLRYPDGTGFISSLNVTLIQKISGGVVTELYNEGNPASDNPPLGPTVVSLDIDEEVTLDVGDVIRFFKIEPIRSQEPSPTPDWPEVAALEIIPIRYRDEAGDPIISVRDLNKVELTKVVPDMSFIDLVSVLRLWKNYGLTLTGKTVTMDLIQPKLDRTAAMDLSDHDIEEPRRTFPDERSIELAFTDGKAHETYKYDSIFVDKSGHKVNDYRTTDNTQPIHIDALTLPVITREGVTTAHAFEDETSKLRLVFYRAMAENSKPACYDNQNLLIPNVYDKYYKIWLDFRVNSVTYEWNFVISVEKFRDIQLQSLNYAYRNYHVFTEIEKERISLLNWRITAKSESLQ